MTTTPDSGGRRLAYNIGGGILGVILAVLAIFGMVAQQGSQTTPQDYSQHISYDQ